MKKNRTMKIATLMLALTLLTCCFVGSTFAKYASETSGSDAVTVAKWSFEVNDTEIAVANNASTPTFNLFDTGANYDDNDDGEEDVADERVAPGTEGSFSMKVENTSEVSVKYTVEFEVTFPTGLTSADFKFYSDADMQTEITPVDGVYTVVNAVEIEAGDAAEKTSTVYWAWDFDGDDTAVGILAQNGTTQVTVEPTISVEQVD